MLARRGPHGSYPAGPTHPCGFGTLRHLFPALDLVGEFQAHISDLRIRHILGESGRSLAARNPEREDCTNAFFATTTVLVFPRDVRTEADMEMTHGVRPVGNQLGLLNSCIVPPSSTIVKPRLPSKGLVTG
jgi:hypothetical protein